MNIWFSSFNIRGRSKNVNKILKKNIAFRILDILIIIILLKQRKLYIFEKYGETTNNTKHDKSLSGEKKVHWMDYALYFHFCPSNYMIF